jgi:hypothetical protein
MTHKAAPILPPLPPQRSLPMATAWVIFSRQQFADLGHQFTDLAARQQSQYDAAELTLQLLGTFTSALEGIMSTLDDLNAQLDAIAASESAEAASLAALGAALTTIITDLQNLPPAGKLTQAELDAVVQKATDTATAAAANAATSAAESSQASGAVPPTPPTP